ncbi:unnamed protein product, partial [Didymodactylos carnosus]
LSIIMLVRKRSSYKQEKYRRLNNNNNSNKMTNLNEYDKDMNMNDRSDDEEEEQIVMSLKDPPFFSDNRNIKPTSV